jgi:hypothetical protein
MQSGNYKVLLKEIKENTDDWCGSECLYYQHVGGRDLRIESLSSAYTTK